MTTKSLTYKVAKFNNEKIGKTLQTLLAAALNKRKAAVSRKMEVDSADHFSLINYHGPHKGIRVGMFFDYTHGEVQPLAKFDATAEELEISALAPPDKDSDFVHSILYFGVWGNSVFLSQAMSLRAAQFEAYLNWLLTETKQLDEGDFVSLVDNPPEEVVKKIKDTKKIEFQAPVTLEPIGKAGGKLETKSIAYRPKNIGWEIIKSILPPEMKLPTEIAHKDIVHSGDLQVTLLLHWSRMASDDSTQLLDTISNQLRHVETELDYTIHTKSGTISRDQMKLRTSVNVGLNKDGLPKRSDMWERIEEWRDQLVQQGRISADM